VFMLVSENPDVIDQLRRALNNEIVEMHNADNAMLAEAYIGGIHPTLIVLDVEMTNGWQLLQNIKQRDDTFDIPLVLISSKAEDQARAADLGARFFVQRPFLPDQFLNLVYEGEQEGQTERILIIDDQPEAVRLLTQLLDQHGRYRIFSAPDGQQGIAMVARRRPDLVILDLRMPNMDGFAVLNELRNNYETRNIPVVIVTGDILNASEKDILSNISVLYKPEISQSEYDTFIREIRQHLGQEE
jgi:CheY-like chemotaxis protein